MALDPFKTSSAIGSQLNDAAVDPFDNGSALRGGLNQTNVGLARSLFARPAQVGVFPEPRFAKGGLVKRVVQQQMHEQRRKLPMFQEPAPEYKAEGGPVEEPRPTTMAEDTVDAKLNPDEYVIPAEVVRKKGTEFFDNLVQNVQGKRKGIVPVMQGGKMYAATGGTGEAAIAEANKRINATKIPLNTDTVKTGTSLAGNAVNAVAKTVGDAVKAANPNNFSPETKNAILDTGNKALGIFKNVRDYAMGGKVLEGARNLGQSQKQEFENLRGQGAGPGYAYAASFKKPVQEVAKTVGEGVNSALDNTSAFFAPPKTNAAPVEAVASATPPVKATPVSATQPATQDATSVSPKVQAQDATKFTTTPLDNGFVRTQITPEYAEQLRASEPKVTPEQQAARDAESEKVLAGILNAPKDAFSTAKFDPVEQYKQKLAADLAYKQKVADMQELQYRNYGKVFPGENTYGNVDNSVTTKQMELDAAGRTTPQEQFKNELELAKLQMEREKAGRNKYRPVPQLDGSVNMVAVEGPEADAMVQAQQARQRKQELMRKSLLAQNDDSATDEQKSAAKEILRRLAIEGIYDPDKSE